LHLKKMPPMPVTFFIFVWLLDCFVMIVLNAKPKQNDVAMVKISKAGFFILPEFILSVVSSVTLPPMAVCLRISVALQI
jgi:hypothetical protein